MKDYWLLSRFLTKQERKSLKQELRLERNARFADFKTAIMRYFANIKQYRPELESPMTLKFLTLGT
jgi:hypothetical protein